MKLDLHEGLVVKRIQTPEVIVRLAHIAGDGRGQGAEAALSSASPGYSTSGTW